MGERFAFPRRAFSKSIVFRFAMHFLQAENPASCLARPRPSSNFAELLQVGYAADPALR